MAEILKPQKGPQELFLSSPADIAGYGGAAGGGKTFAELLEPLRHINNPGFTAVIFRRTSEQIRQTGGLWDASAEIYAKLGAKGREQQLDWRFPSGATIRLDSLQHEQDKLQFQGAEICLLEFDELTHFTESQFFYLLSRNRSMCGVRPYVRATFNPDPNSWVKQFFAPWVDRQYPDRAESGELRYFVRDGGLITWVPKGTPDAKSVTFIRSTVYDNQILLAKNPEYVASLKAMSLVDRLRLLDGDWDATESGNMFRREWFQIVDAAPANARKVRYWDFAGTEVKEGKDPDWTAGCRMSMDGENIAYIEDMRRLRGTPKSVEELVKQTAEIDGKDVAIYIEQEPGSSGVTVIDHYVRKVLHGWNVHGIKSTGSKADRAKPLSAQAEAGNIKIVRGYWNEDYLNEVTPFPNPKIHDDQVDASSGAFTHLARQPQSMSLISI
jgi:predicted phage terminase large subunit-like protein